MSDFDIALATDTTDMSVAFQEFYEKLEVRKKAEEITNEVTKCVNSLVKKYTNDKPLDDAKRMIDMIAKIETKSVASLYKQTVYLEHLIDTVIERIDESFGGSIADYMALMQLQNSLLAINSHLLIAIRQLPINIRTSIHQALDTFSIQVEEAESESSNGLIARSAELMLAIEQIQDDVRKKNAEVDSMQPDKLPSEWDISDDALIAANDVEEAKQIDLDRLAQIKQEAESKYTDDEFD